MKPDDSPIERKSLRQCALGEFLDALASDAILPGAGAAGGVALALAAACAEKAVAITRRHDANPALEELQKQLSDLAKRALELGQQDALQFKQQLKSNDSAAAQKLLRTDYTILDTCRALDRLLQDNGELIADNMSGDWKAAHALLHACRVIHNENVRELKAGE
jgi:flagellar biosynthesis/type III secretory pathway chaperone